MQQIADWLKMLGMSEYAERFAENGIDISVLRDLTDQDLKDIGVLLGHRRKILRAIGELSSAAPLTTKPAVGTEPKAQDTAERRQVTVMFSDLVGSTALSARVRDAIPKVRELATAEFATLRLRLLKIAARVVETTSRIRLAFAAACPEADLFRSLPGALLPLGP